MLFLYKVCRLCLVGERKVEVPEGAEETTEGVAEGEGSTEGGGI